MGGAGLPLIILPWMGIWGGHSSTYSRAVPVSRDATTAAWRNSFMSEFAALQIMSSRAHRWKGTGPPGPQARR